MVSALFITIVNFSKVNILKIVTNLQKNKTPPAFVRLTGFANETSEIASTKATDLPKRGELNCK